MRARCAKSMDTPKRTAHSCSKSGTSTTPPHKETTMTSPYIEAFMLGYIKAALKEQINPEEVDALFGEAERFARSSFREREQIETK